jgi:hypothetical protein
MNLNTGDRQAIAELLESQAREIELLKLLANDELLVASLEEIKELRAALVAIEKWLYIALDSGDKEYVIAAFTRCKEAL